jgi:formylglycine-generating enzyme required for sulfatase activity
MPADAAPAADVSPKAKIFISYSRKDMAFADRLEAALTARGFEVLIDRREIYAFEDWWKRIEVLIGRADTVVYVLSPDSVKSDVALKEVAYAASLNKRFAPIVCRRVEDAAVPEALRRLNFIFFDDAERFDDDANKLAEALQTDIGWVRQHTEYGEAQRRWSAAGRPNSLLFRPPTLDVAEYWMGSRPAGAPETTEEIAAFLAASRRSVRSAQRLRRIAEVSIVTLMMSVILGLVGWINQQYLADQWRWWTITRPYAAAVVSSYVLTPAHESALKPGDSFEECEGDSQRKAPSACPEMVVVPAGTFLMGSPATEKGRNNSEEPQHEVTIAKAFAVSKFELTFDQWDTCVEFGNCDPYIPDSGFLRFEQPVINLTWNDALVYARWLSSVTGKQYRLLSEAEYEYAARAGTQTAYPWGDEIGKNNTDCQSCGSEYDNKKPTPVGGFPPNRFGLYDMVGNVFEWTQDCWHENYNGAPTDGSSWIEGGNCDERVARGGDWHSLPAFVSSAARAQVPVGRGTGGLEVGMRVARTLGP